jgi:hypothetical protein
MMGGYGVGTTLPDFQLYPKHHPDCHAVVFYPDDVNRMISVHDGGISRTQNCLASNVTWEYLNNGYVTTQFYTITQDAASTSKFTVGGTQDNGTYACLAPDARKEWYMPLSYDGSYCYVKPGGGEVYLSIQQGRMHRMILDAEGKATQYTRIDPKGVDKNIYEFINPFTPDANNFKVLYTPAQTVIWRNSDITAIPLKSKLDSNASNINWVELSNTRLTVAGDEITSIFSSKSQNDVLYYGTRRGRLFRLSNASNTSSVPVLISGTNFPSAYLHCITQDPTDSARMFVVFTNYGVHSLFETKDAGLTWQPIGGNLEQTSTGGGNGPSCRWFTIAPTQDSLVYFVGTSTGLYATKKIDGMQTVWTRQGASSIGMQPVTMMHHRTTDGRMVVSTYGSGVFESYVNSLNPTTSIKENKLNDFVVYPNPTTNYIWFKGLSNETNIRFEIYNLQGAKVKQGNIVSNEGIDVQELPEGMYILKLQMHGNWHSKTISIK